MQCIQEFFNLRTKITTLCIVCLNCKQYHRRIANMGHLCSSSEKKERICIRNATNIESTLNTSPSTFNAQRPTSQNLSSRICRWSKRSDLLTYLFRFGLAWFVLSFLYYYALFFFFSFSHTRESEISHRCGGNFIKSFAISQCRFVLFSKQ